MTGYDVIIISDTQKREIGVKKIEYVCGLEGENPADVVKSIGHNYSINTVFLIKEQHRNNGFATFNKTRVNDQVKIVPAEKYFSGDTLFDMLEKEVDDSEAFKYRY
jgi:hypothetical protein